MNNIGFVHAITTTFMMMSKGVGVEPATPCMEKIENVQTAPQENKHWNHLSCIEKLHPRCAATV